MEDKKDLQHFILTRFNLLIFNKDKEGQKVRSASWLEHRIALFERYCLPSIIAQTCQCFKWIVLFDSTTPERLKEKIAEYQKSCPQLKPVYVRPESGRFFSQIFRDEVVKRVQEVQKFDGLSRVLTTYLDNDDALSAQFVEDVQRRAEALPDGTFITYDSGYQFFTDYKYMMRINFPRNHFMSVVESGNASFVQTIYGYGSHYYINKIKGVRIEHVKDLPMWCEVIHNRNMGNDAYFLRAKMVRDADGFDFMVHGSSGSPTDSSIRYGLRLYLFRFLPRYVRTFVRRIGYFFFGRHW